MDERPPGTLLARLRGALRTRHYSPRTADAYAGWVKRFVRFHGMRHPAELGNGGVAEFLTWLAEQRQPVKRKVASKKTKPVKRAKSFKKIVSRLSSWDRAKIAALAAKPREIPDWTPEDAAVFDIPKPPSGFAYQWSPFSRIEYMRSRGWSQVPFSRHPEMAQSTNFDGYIVYRDTALFQISKELADAEHDRLKEVAKDLTRDYDSMLGKEPGYGGRGFVWMMPASFTQSAEYEQYSDDRGSVDVQLTITLRVPARWCDTANALKLAHAEYARRRVLMSGHLLACDPYASDPDVGVFSPFDLTTKKVEI